MFKKILDFFKRSKPKVNIDYFGENDFNSAFYNCKILAVHQILTLEILNNIHEDKLLQVVMDNLSEKLTVSPEEEVPTVIKWNKSRQAVYMVWWLDAEVNNGGFNQYYANPSGEFFQMLPDALELIGAVKIANLMHVTNQLYEAEFDEITEAQDGTVEGFAASYENNPLEAMDEAFFELYKTEYLLELLEKYIRVHKDDFVDA